MFSILVMLIYLSFISLGLPDAVLGSAWPMISVNFGIPVSYMGIIAVIISFGTIISSLQSDRLIKKLGVRRITILSISLTAIALLGFSFSSAFGMLCLWAIPYGLGAGSVDSALNNYVAVNFESKHMSWLHCMWGIGATTGPFIMGMVLAQGNEWNDGYFILFIIQIILIGILTVHKKAWNTKGAIVESHNNTSVKALSFKEIISIDGVPQIMITFFCFCALEQTAGFWASSYLTLSRGVPMGLAVSFAGLFYLGITIGRGVNGFIVMKYSNTKMIQVGAGIMIVGIAVLLLPFGEITALLGLIIVGLGSAPVFPCIIHSTPGNFGVENAQAITGVLMASAYTGTLVMPALFGVLADHISINLYPLFLGVLLFIMIVMYESMLKKLKRNI